MKEPHELGDPIALNNLHVHALREGAPAELLQERVDSSSVLPEFLAEERTIEQLKIRSCVDLMDAEEIPLDGGRTQPEPE